MQLTRKTEYAVRTLLELAQRPYGEFVQTKEIAAAKNIPEVFLAKTIQDLARAGFVDTQRGTKGGVRLVRPGENFTLADVVEAIEGPLAINPCLKEGGDCPNKTVCKVRQIFLQAQEALIRELSSVTFAELAGPKTEIP